MEQERKNHERRKNGRKYAYGDVNKDIIITHDRSTDDQLLLWRAQKGRDESNWMRVGKAEMKLV